MKSFPVLVLGVIRDWTLLCRGLCTPDIYYSRHGMQRGMPVFPTIYHTPSYSQHRAHEYH